MNKIIDILNDTYNGLNNFSKDKILKNRKYKKLLTKYDFDYTTREIDYDIDDYIYVNNSDSIYKIKDNLFITDLYNIKHKIIINNNKFINVFNTNQRKYYYIKKQINMNTELNILFNMYKYEKNILRNNRYISKKIYAMNGSQYRYLYNNYCIKFIYTKNKLIYMKKLKNNVINFFMLIIDKLWCNNLKFFIFGEMSAKIKLIN